MTRAGRHGLCVKHLLKRAGDEVGSYVAEVCERELIARLGG